MRTSRIIVRFLRESPKPRESEAPEEGPPVKPFKYSDPNEISIDPFAPEPSETEPVTRNPFVVPEGASEPVAAAPLLAQHGYPDALTEIRKLAAKTEGDEREILEVAAAILSQAPEK